MQNIIKQVLDEQGWRYLENNGIYKIDVEGENSSWSSYIKSDEGDSFSYYSTVPVRANAENIMAICELVSQLNYQLKIGAFEINQSHDSDLQYGQILFKTYGIIPSEIKDEMIPTLKEIVQKAIAYNMLTMDRYVGIILKAIYTENNNQ